MKKLCLFLFGCMLFFGGQIFGYLEDKMYCKIEGEQLTLYVKKEEGLHKCDTYLQAIQQLAREKYDEVLFVLEYINQWSDPVYWGGIFELKKQEFLKLARYRTTIQTMIQEFEQKFLVKYQDSLRQNLLPYLSHLQEIEELLKKGDTIPLHSENPRILQQQITQQIVVVQSLLTATTLNEIMEKIPNYLYLKQQLEWK